MSEDRLFHWEGLGDLLGRAIHIGRKHGNELESIRDRARAATPGPWLFDGPRQMVIDGNGRHIAKVSQWGPNGVRGATVQDFENARFIAASRDDIDTAVCIAMEAGDELRAALKILERVVMTTTDNELHDDIASAAIHYGWWTS